ncbi:Zn-ribbon domain-containing OB-fold protein [Actinomadura rugatobispora]|uniref:Zn-ribbon domain-containing OB-fold protein n=1 Tax=Actinomadura rugatobispora TaxID=1994 RepID=A0ABW1ABZ1_9ACTN|nr:OB-fold domain-containing protein [Actinomadura rugatobispora]
MPEIASTPETRPFWDGIAAGELRLQRCDECLRSVFYPRAICPHCHCDRLSWRTASGKGTVYSYTVAHRVAGGFSAQVPYTIALIDLDEGPRMLSRVIGDAPVRIGDRVHLEIARLEGESSPELPCFRVTTA